MKGQPPAQGFAHGIGDDGDGQAEVSALSLDIVDLADIEDPEGVHPLGPEAGEGIRGSAVDGVPAGAAGGLLLFVLLRARGDPAELMRLNL